MEDFDSVIEPIRFLSQVLLLFPTCFSYPKTKLQHALSLLLTLNLALITSELILFSVYFFHKKEFGLAIVVISGGVYNFLAAFCGLCFNVHRETFRDLLAWCKERYEARHVDPTFARYLKVGIQAFYLINSSFILCLYGGFNATNYFFGTEKFQNTYPVHLPGLKSTTFARFLVNETVLFAASLYATILAFIFFAPFFVTLKFLFDRVGIMMDKIRSPEVVLKEVVQIHTEVVEVHRKLSSVASQPFFCVQAVTFPMTFLVWFTFSVEPDYKMFGMCASLVVVEVFVFIHANEMVVDQFDEFFFEVYNMPWYQLPVKDQKVILVILAQKVPSLNGGGIYPMTHEMFQIIMNKAYSTCLVIQDVIAAMI